MITTTALVLALATLPSGKELSGTLARAIPTPIPTSDEFKKTNDTGESQHAIRYSYLASEHTEVDTVELEGNELDEIESGTPGPGEYKVVDNTGHAPRTYDIIIGDCVDDGETVTVTVTSSVSDPYFEFFGWPSLCPAPPD